MWYFLQAQTETDPPLNLILTHQRLLSLVAGSLMLLRLLVEKQCSSRTSNAQKQIQILFIQFCPLILAPLEQKWL